MQKQPTSFPFYKKNIILIKFVTHEIFIKINEFIYINNDDNFYEYTI